MTEEDEAFNEIERQAQQRKESVMAAAHTLTEYQRGYENGFVDGVQKQTESAVTKMMNGGIRNDTISEVLQLIKELRPAIKPLEGMGKGKTTQEWFDILAGAIKEKL
jgi:flagellar biosynthesis/type III secretory pathway protein FliH